MILSLWLLAALPQSLAQSQPLPAPIAQASSGQLQCYSPDKARKTCKSLAGYRRDDKGGIINDARVLLSPEPLIVMATSDPVVIKNSQVCGVVTAEDLRTSTFVIRGQSASAQQQAVLLDQLIPGYAPMLDKEICTAYPVDGDGLSAVATIGGVPAPSEHVIWVLPTDGWTVAP